MDERVWTNCPITRQAPLIGTRCVIALENAPHLSIVSGSLSEAIGHLCPGAPIIGLAELAEHENFAIRIARDHAVLATRMPLDRAPGWQSEGFAFSQADDRYAALSLRGDGAEDVLCRGLHFALPQGSLSCAVRFAHKTVLITGVPNGFTLWVDRADLTYFSTFLAGLSLD